MTFLTKSNSFYHGDSFSDGEYDLFGPAVVFDVLVEFVELLAADVGVVVEEGAERVVGQDDAVLGEEAVEGEFVVLDVVLLVGVEENDVEGGALLFELLHELRGGADAEVELGGDGGAVEGCARDLGGGGVALEGDDLAVVRERFGEGERAHAGEGADVEDGAGALEAAEHLEELRLERADHAGREEALARGLRGDVLEVLGDEAR